MQEVQALFAEAETATSWDDEALARWTQKRHALFASNLPPGTRLVADDDGVSYLDQVEHRPPTAPTMPDPTSPDSPPSPCVYRCGDEWTRRVREGAAVCNVYKDDPFPWSQQKWSECMQNVEDVEQAQYLLCLASCMLGGG